ncbi:MAG: C40 family peptidase [Fimbriimonadaceae bacterium]|nr:C40 family peptidase [Chitinophagales bacterium]
MEFGIATLSVIPVRSKPGHEYELVNQLLFGETYTIDESQGKWLRITSDYDNYSGWINEKQNNFITEQQFKSYRTSVKYITAELVQTISNNSKSFPVLMGSTLYEFDGMNCKLLKENYVYAGQVIIQSSENKKPELIKKLALKFLNAPYLWGGRTAFGIDCSGFTQVVFKVGGINLPRDAYQQAEHGKTINFIYEAKEGDLAFFDNEEERITHTGIISGENEIIHASGKVRSDTIDHHGIFNKELKKYTHKLRIIKRMI